MSPKARIFKVVGINCSKRKKSQKVTLHDLDVKGSFN